MKLVFLHAVRTGKLTVAELVRAEKNQGLLEELLAAGLPGSIYVIFVHFDGLSTCFLIGLVGW